MQGPHSSIGMMGQGGGLGWGVQTIFGSEILA